MVQINVTVKNSSQIGELVCIVKARLLPSDQLSYIPFLQLSSLVTDSAVFWAQMGLEFLGGIYFG